MWVRVKNIEQGLHPSEAIITIDTAYGSEELIMDRRAIQQNAIEVGSPVASSEDDQHHLVELPTETSRGAWRVWVAKSQLSKLIQEPAE